MLSSIGLFMPKRKRENERSEEGDAGIAVLPCLLALPPLTPHRLPSRRTYDNEPQLPSAVAKKDLG